ncbi:MAG: hypothetical protein OHK0038_25380 [Flammeovirgaceae bacterium]
MRKNTVNQEYSKNNLPLQERLLKSLVFESYASKILEIEQQVYLELEAEKEKMIDLHQQNTSQKEMKKYFDEKAKNHKKAREIYVTQIQPKITVWHEEAAKGMMTKEKYSQLLDSLKQATGFYQLGISNKEASFISDFEVYVALLKEFPELRLQENKEGLGKALNVFRMKQLKN